MCYTCSMLLILDGFFACWCVVIVQELKSRPCPVIFLAFSGAPKACMYKVLQVNEKDFTFI